MNELETTESKIALLEEENEWLKEYVKWLESQVQYLNIQRPYLKPWNGYHPTIRPMPSYQYQPPQYLSDNTCLQLGDDVEKWADQLARDIENLND